MNNTKKEEKFKLLEKNNLFVADKDWLFNELLKKSGLVDKKIEAEKKVYDFVEQLIFDYLLPEDLKSNYKKAKRIIDNNNEILICGYELGMSTKDNDRFPNSIIGIDDYDPKVNDTVQVSRAFYSKNLPKLPREILTKEDKLETDKSKGYFVFKLRKEYLDKIPPIKLDILKRLYMEFLTANYNIANFLIDIYPERRGGVKYQYKTYHFLHNKTTWGQVRTMNEEWFMMLVENRLSDEDKKKVITPIDEIEELKKIFTGIIV